LNPEQLHRFEGIFIYFGFLLMLFAISESKNSETPRDMLRQSFFPLFVYYATALGMPLANGAYRQGRDFWEHSLFVLVIPLLLILPLATFRFLSSLTICRAVAQKLKSRSIFPGGKRKTQSI
jgi:predicted permease